MNRVGLSSTLQGLDDRYLSRIFIPPAMELQQVESSFMYFATQVFHDFPGACKQVHANTSLIFFAINCFLWCVEPNFITVEMIGFFVQQTSSGNVEPPPSNLGAAETNEGMSAISEAPGAAPNMNV